MSSSMKLLAFLLAFLLAPIAAFAQDHPLLGRYGDSKQVGYKVDAYDEARIITGKINERGSTAVAPFSTRARPGAAVAMPVAWEMLEKELAPDAFKAPKVMESGPPEDAWAGFFSPKRALKGR